MKILVAEDNAVTATLMTGILTRHGYTVVLARNGSEALRLLGSDPEIRGVITDIMMPESSGLDLLQGLRDNEAWRDLPTIVATVRDDPETVSAAVALGCREYVLKPVRPARLIERVTKVFPLEKVILMKSTEVMSQYSLSLDTYRRIAKNFAALVDSAIAELQIWAANNDFVLHVEFIQITEGATLLGAERLLAALEEASPTPESPALSLRAGTRLLEELQKVRKGLCAQIG